jgi:hypothetical protein
MCGISVENSCKTMKNIKSLFYLFSPLPLPSLQNNLLSSLIIGQEEEIGRKCFISSDEINKVEIIAPEEVEGEGEEWMNNSLSGEFTGSNFSFSSFFSPSSNFLLSSSPLDSSHSLSLSFCSFSLSSLPSSSILFSLLSLLFLSL